MSVCSSSSWIVGIHIRWGSITLTMRGISGRAEILVILLRICLWNPEIGSWERIVTVFGVGIALGLRLGEETRGIQCSLGGDGFLGWHWGVLVGARRDSLLLWCRSWRCGLLVTVVALGFYMLFPLMTFYVPLMEEWYPFQWKWPCTKELLDSSTLHPEWPQGVSWPQGISRVRGPKNESSRLFWLAEGG
jgi:hypothetical protein